MRQVQRLVRCSQAHLVRAAQRRLPVEAVMLLCSLAQAEQRRCQYHHRNHVPPADDLASASARTLGHRFAESSRRRSFEAPMFRYRLAMRRMSHAIRSV